MGVPWDIWAVGSSASSGVSRTVACKGILGRPGARASVSKPQISFLRRLHSWDDKPKSFPHLGVVLNKKLEIIGEQRSILKFQFADALTRHEMG